MRHLLKSTKSLSSQPFCFWRMDKSQLFTVEVLTLILSFLNLSTSTVRLTSSLAKESKKKLNHLQLNHGLIWLGHSWPRIQLMIFAYKKMVPFVLFMLHLTTNQTQELTMYSKMLNTHSLQKLSVELHSTLWD